jgi:hypothetical protein
MLHKSHKEMEERNMDLSKTRQIQLQMQKLSWLLKVTESGSDTCRDKFILASYEMINTYKIHINLPTCLPIYQLYIE